MLVSMEPKLIKEEIPDRENSRDSKDSVSSLPRLRKGRRKGITKERVKSPDSPEGARVNQIRTSPPAVITTTVTPITGSVANIQTPTVSSVNLTPTAVNQPTSPKVSSFQNGATTPPLYAQNGNTSPALSVTLSDNQQIGRPLGKIKRFLSTLVQFGQDIAPETGERVKTLVLSLVSNTLTVEEFHHSLQDVTNFPLRPFVLPFLRAYLPPLQRELNTQARATKQSLPQYLRQHEHSVLDPAFSPSEPSEIFHHTEHADKRRATDSYYENGLGSMDDASYLPPQAKRPNHSGLLFPLHPLALPPTHMLHPEYSQHGYTPSYPINNYSSHREGEERRGHGEDEWKNIHVMLNCILSMVEKTKRALGILQHRTAGENGHVTDWLPRRDLLRTGNTNNSSSAAEDVKRTAGEIMAHTIRLTEDRVAEVKRKAEEAVNEVKRQAVAELQRAVAAAESKACELVASERAKMEKLVSDARKQAAEEATIGSQSNTERSDTPPAIPAPSQQNSCWNCGRKANETCSGCNTARYCGAFCQHKDWENHHQVCCGRTNGTDKSVPRPMHSSRSVTPVTATSSSTSSNTVGIVPLNCTEERGQK